MRTTFLTLMLLLSALITTAQEPAIASYLSCHRFTTLDGLPQMQVETIWQDSEGYVWVGTLSGFARYDGRTLTPFLKGRRENIVRFAATPTGVSALGFMREWRVDGDKCTKRQLDPAQHWLLNNFNSSALPASMVLMEDEEETHRWLGQVTEQGVKPLVRSEVLDRLTPDRKLFVDDETTYVPTSDGLFVMRGNRYWKISDKADVYTFARSASTLYALAGDGIYAVKGEKLQLLASHEFSDADYGLLAKADRHGTLYIADEHSLYQLHDGRVEQLSSGYNLIKDLLVDRWDRVWLATYQGAYLFFGTAFVNHRLNDANDVVRALGVDAQGRVVMGTLNGALLIDGMPVKNMPANDFFVPNSATIGRDVFLAGNGDVMKLSGDQAQWLSLGQRRYYFVADAGQWLIVGSRPHLMRYNPLTQQLDTITSEVGHAWRATTDAQGNLWVASSAALFKVTGWQGNEASVDTLAYGSQKLTVSTIQRDKAGHILFASADSLFAVVNGQIKCLNDQLPMLATHQIRSLHVSPRGYLVAATIDGLLVAKLGNDLTTSDAHWFDHNNGFTIVEAQNAIMTEQADGTVWLAGLEEMVSFNPKTLLTMSAESTFIEAPKPWWARWPVWAAGTLLLAATCWVVARRYERRRHKAAMQRLQREKQLKELQINATRLKAIPHFHSNVMAGIEYFVMNNSSAEASQYLKMYSNFTNQTLADIDRPARSVAEEVEYIGNYLELEKLRLGERLRYTITVSPQVDRHTLLPTMLLYTYCQNAVKHGIVNKPEGGQVDVEVNQVDDALVVTVRDNGVGRKAAARYNTKSSKQGLRILREQIALYNQENSRHIVERVEDLYDEQGNACGTLFEMTIPLNYHFSDDDQNKHEE